MEEMVISKNRERTRFGFVIIKLPSKFKAREDFHQNSAGVFSSSLRNSLRRRRNPPAQSHRREAGLWTGCSPPC